MFTIKMLETRRGVDSHDVKCYNKGDTFVVGKDIGDTLARSFIAKAWATEIQQVVSTPTGACMYV